MLYTYVRADLTVHVVALGGGTGTAARCVTGRHATRTDALSNIVVRLGAVHACR